MATLYKLTTQDNFTRKGEANETLWDENVTHSKQPKDKAKLCSEDVIHAYLDPRLAVILNPIHADIRNPRLWIAEGDIVLSEGQLKVGTFSLTTLKEVPLPEISDTQLLAFAILCAKEVFKDSAWNAWADKWLSGEDRSAESAYSAAYAAYAYAYAASNAASYASYYASYASSYASYAASYASYAASYASVAKQDIDLIKILDEVMEKY